MLNERQLKEKIYQLEIELKTLKEILEGQELNLMGRPKGSYNYSEEEVNFMKANKTKKMLDLVQEFNKKFNRNFPKHTRALYNFMVRNGIIEQGFKRYSYMGEIRNNKFEQKELS